VDVARNVRERNVNLRTVGSISHGQDRRKGAKAGWCADYRAAAERIAADMVNWVAHVMGNLARPEVERRAWARKSEPRLGFCLSPLRSLRHLRTHIQPMGAT
jgi:hypothetical protein